MKMLKIGFHAHVWKTGDDVNQALKDVSRLFLDTAPIIYFVEQNSAFVSKVNTIFDRIDEGLLTAVTSPVSLAECLIIPIRNGLVDIQQNYTDLITAGNSTDFVSIDDYVAQTAAQLRANYNLSLSDALQIAAAIESECDAFLTNDIALKRVTDIKIILLNDIELSEEIG